MSKGYMDKGVGNKSNLETKFTMQTILSLVYSKMHPYIYIKSLISRTKINLWLTPQILILSTMLVVFWGKREHQ